VPDEIFLGDESPNMNLDDIMEVKSASTNKNRPIAVVAEEVS
jgi:hypothetical protein